MSRKRGRSDQPGYEVGYGKPPSHTRFQAGRSGNPKGRPKKDTSQENALQRVLAQPIPVMVDGRRKLIPASEALLQKLLQMALAGNIRALNILTRFVATQEGPRETTLVEDEEMSPDDEDVIARYLQRRGGGQEHPDRAGNTGGSDE